MYYYEMAHRFLERFPHKILLIKYVRYFHILLYFSKSNIKYQNLTLNILHFILFLYFLHKSSDYHRDTFREHRYHKKHAFRTLDSRNYVNIHYASILYYLKYHVRSK